MTMTERVGEPLVAAVPPAYNTFEAETKPEAGERPTEPGVAVAPGDTADAAKLTLVADVTPSVRPPPQLMPTILMFMASVLFSGMHSCVRHTTTAFAISPVFVAWFRGCLQGTLATILIFIFHKRTLSADAGLSRSGMFFLVARGGLGAVSVLSKYTSLSLIPVAIASSLFATTPIFAVLLGWFFLGETLTITDRVVLAITTFASFLVGSSETSLAHLSGLRSPHILGVLLALNGAVMTGSVFVLMKYMGTRVHFLYSVFAMGYGSAMGAVILYSIERGSPLATVKDFSSVLQNASPGAWAGLGGVFFFGFAAALCLNRGAQLLAAGRSGLIRTFDIPNNFLVGYLFLGELPNAPGQIFGCVLIALSMLLLATKTLR